MHPRRPVPAALAELAACQGGVLTVEQALALGLTPMVVRRLCQEQWQRPARGLLWTGRGELPWSSWAWAGVLAAGDHARLGPESSGHLWGLVVEPPTPVDVLVPPPASCVRRGPWRFSHDTPGVRSPRSVGAPPRLTALDTVLDLTGSRDPGGVVDLVTRAVQQRLVATTALQQALDRRKQHRHRRLLTELLADVSDGVESGLELHYLRDVERAHALPVGRRNRYRGGLRYRSDVGYDEFAVLIELDGRLGHEGSGRFRDFRRDNEFAMHSLVTLRYGWEDVVHRPCEVADQVAIVLRSRGWSGLATRCTRCRLVC